MVIIGCVARTRSLACGYRKDDNSFPQSVGQRPGAGRFYSQAVSNSHSKRGGAGNSPRRFERAAIRLEPGAAIMPDE